MANKLKKYTISFIGGGNMAQALIGGMLAQGVKPQQIMVSDPSDGVREQLSLQKLKTTTDGLEAIEFADVVILAIKPQLFSAVLPVFAGKFSKQLVISVAAGVTVDSISQILQHDNIVRAMPNTPALIQTGATGLYAASGVSEEAKQIASDVMGASGMALWVDDESLMHAVTAASGSAPAYFFNIMEAMIAGAQELGLDEKQAKSLVLQTALGAAQMAITSDDDPATLRKKVTSPNGTTQAALESMAAADIMTIMQNAMKAAADRSQSLSVEMAEQLSAST